MPRWSFSLGLVLLALAACDRGAGDARGAAVGDPFEALGLLRAKVPTPAKAFTVPSLFGRPLSLADVKERVVLRYAGRPQPGDRDFDAVRVTYDGGHRALVIDPGDVLRPGRIVELLLLPGIVDTDGLPLEPRGARPVGSAVDVLRYQVAAF